VSREDVAVMKEIFDAVEKRRYSAMVDYYHPNVEIYEPESLPYGGHYKGYPGASKHAAGWTTTWDPLQPSDEDRRLKPELIDAGDCVIARYRIIARKSDDGACLEVPVFAIYRPEDRRLRELRMFYWDTEAINRFLGRQPVSA
jgi:ketosteroid isomerase-like protein